MAIIAIEFYDPEQNDDVVIDSSGNVTVTVRIYGSPAAPTLTSSTGLVGIAVPTPGTGYIEYSFPINVGSPADVTVTVTLVTANQGTYTGSIDFHAVAEESKKKPVAGT